jgi:hypothetical protein
MTLDNALRYRIVSFPTGLVCATYPPNVVQYNDQEPHIGEDFRLIQLVDGSYEIMCDNCIGNALNGTCFTIRGINQPIYLDWWHFTNNINQRWIIESIKDSGKGGPLYKIKSSVDKDYVLTVSTGSTLAMALITV